MISPLLTIDAAANALSVTPRTMRRMVNQKTIESVRVKAHTIRISETALQAFISKRTIRK